jgi:hypothetical protein
MRRSARFRSVALLLAGGYVVHALRYVLAYEATARHELLEEGHEYLGAAPVALTVLLAAAFGELLVRVARGGGDSAPQVPLRRLWAVSAAALLGIFVIQESIEGLIASGHAAGLAVLVAHGGWLAVPLSLAVGLVLALLHRGAQAVLAEHRRHVRLPRLRPVAVLLRWPSATLGASRIVGPWRRGRGPPAFAG